ncbi:MAG: aminotransferase class V-fold PLP-dependent enzyme, partial [Thermodesulfobacteriota bacterium]
GVMNDLEGLNEICISKGIRLCMDCVSSIGTVPIDLNGVYLASGVSGKGLGAFPGLSMVFYNHEIQPISHRIPRYLDLGLYSTSKGIPFTISSNLLYALKKAVEAVNPNHRYQEILGLSSWLRQRLNQIGFKILADEANASPALITIALPGWISSLNLGKRLEQEGYLLSYRSEYLLKRNWIQISLMGECSQDIFHPLLDLLEKIYSQACRAS